MPVPCANARMEVKAVQSGDEPRSQSNKGPSAGRLQVLCLCQTTEAGRDWGGMTLTEPNVPSGYAPAPAPKRRTGRKVLIGCGGAVAAVVLLVIIIAVVAAVGNNNGSSSGGSST